MKQLNSKLQALCLALQKRVNVEQIHLHELMSAHTTFKIGGPADIFIEPANMTELSLVMEEIGKARVPMTIHGVGSNVLVRDGGIRGVVVSLANMKQKLACQDTVITAGAGYMLKDVSEFAWRHSLTGLEFAIGIPGSLGGAVFMNAGAYDGEMSQVVHAVRAVGRDGVIREYVGPALDFAYRHSLFHDNGEIIGEIDLQLQLGQADKIKERMDELTVRRESKQPLEYPSAGSTFKRPTGYYAGTLIEQTGLKGLSVGDAQVSEKHAGFVINKGAATARDVLGVIHEVQRRVMDAHGVQLEPEVRLIGEDVDTSK